MGAILERIVRLRRLRERTAELALARAQGMEDARAAELSAVNDRMKAATEDGDQDVDSIQRRHSFTLHCEVERRRAEAAFDQSQKQTEVARDRVTKMSLHRQAAESLAEKQAEEIAKEEARSSQAELDEVGIRGWWRGRE